MKRIYLDHNATTVTDPTVTTMVAEIMGMGPLNPASQHATGRHARRLLESARESISTSLNLKLAPPSQEDRLVFTSGGTEANNLLLHGIAAREGARIITSAIEHPSISRTCEALGDRGTTIELCRVNRDGTLDLEHLSELIQTPVDLVSVMMANNETGVIQPVEQAAELCRQFAIPLHTDGAQLAGKKPLDFQGLGLAALTLAAHKFQGPTGIGAVILRHDLAISPLMFGGFQQLGRRPGTEPVALAVGMAEALRLSLERHSEEARRLKLIRDQFESELLANIPSIQIHGADAPRMEHVSSIAFPNVDGQELFVALDMLGIDCSTGSACSSGSSEISPVLLAMGVPKDVASRTIRFSFGAFNQSSDGQIAAERIIKHFKHLQR